MKYFFKQNQQMIGQKKKSHQTVFKDDKVLYSTFDFVLYSSFMCRTTVFLKQPDCATYTKEILLIK